jgi:tetratricopeptide (TPR) repeat protein
VAQDEIAPRAVLAEIHRRRGQYRKAIQYWEAALAINANHLDGRLALTELYYQAGKKEKALCQIRHIAGLRPDSSFEILEADQKKRANLTAWTHDHALLEAAFKHYFRAGLEAMDQGS